MVEWKKETRKKEEQEEEDELTVAVVAAEIALDLHEMSWSECGMMKDGERRLRGG